MNKISIGAPKSIYDASSHFMRELELYKARSDIKPRKSKMMDAQVGHIGDELDCYKAKHVYIPCKDGFL